jgi:MFS family permease
MLHIALLFLGGGNLMCGFAKTPIQLYVFRAISGLGGGGVNGIAMTVVSTLPGRTLSRIYLLIPPGIRRRLLRGQGEISGVYQRSMLLGYSSRAIRGWRSGNRRSMALALLVSGSASVACETFHR